MRAVGQPVDHRNRGIFGHFQQGLFFERADHDEVDITRQYARGICNRFAMAQLHVFARQNHGFATHLAHAHIKTDARAGGRFFKYQRNHLVGQRLIRIFGAFG